MTESILRILITVDPEIPVPPTLYGGIERIVDMLVRELGRRGHEIHLFANSASTVEARLWPYPGQTSISARHTVHNMTHVFRTVRRNGPFDVIHSFARLAYLLPLLPLSQPKIQSYQRFISPRSVRLGAALSRGSLIFTTCSAINAIPVRDLGGRWEIIYNGVEMGKYQYSSIVADDAPLVFLGRVERIKGAHTAIEAARRVGRRLIIAGNHAETGEAADYFSREILPQCDGEQVVYVGPVNDLQKNDLLGRAAALLFPIEIEEPFGIVMAEALACGTPVIALRRGAVPEVVRHAETGFVCDGLEDMVTAISQIGRLNRQACRQDAEHRFSETAITDQYESLYHSVVQRRNGS